MSTEPGKFVFAACQLIVGEDKAENVARARVAIEEAAAGGAKIIALPVCHYFNYYYDNDIIIQKAKNN